MIFVGIDPGFRNVGIVALETGYALSDIPVDAFKLRYEPVKGDKETYETWFDVGYECGEALRDIKQEFSNKKSMSIGMMAPIQTHHKGSCLKIHVASGIIFGISMRYGYALMQRDLQVRRALGPLIGCPLKLKGGAATRFVKQFWPKCSNEHLANAWLMAKYLSITN